MATGPVEVWLEQVLVTKTTSAPAQPGVVSFAVGGKAFQILEQTVRSRGPTLLLDLLDDPARTDKKTPIYVDGDSERFRHILDWYRFGSIRLPISIGLQEMRRECAYYKLPDDVVIKRERFADTMSSIHDTVAKVAKDSERASISAAAQAVLNQLLKDKNLVNNLAKGKISRSYRYCSHYPSEYDTCLIKSVLNSEGGLHRHYDAFKVELDSLASNLGYKVEVTYEGSEKKNATVALVPQETFEKSD